MSALSAAAPLEFRFTSASRSHVGTVREVNEDRLLDRPETGFWALADGMGGHANGAIAAERIIEALAQIKHGASGYAFLADIAREAARINASLFESNVASGSTLVALLAHEGHYACLWAGDSRAYLLRDETLSPVTRDHSLVQQLIDSGALDESERRTHPQGHVITRALGAAQKFSLDQKFATIRNGDRFLLCSDGLTTCVDDAGITRMMIGRSCEESATLLLEAALANGAPDNVSFIVAEAEAFFD